MSGHDTRVGAEFWRALYDGWRGRVERRGAGNYQGEVLFSFSFLCNLKGVHESDRVYIKAYTN